MANYAIYRRPLSIYHGYMAVNKTGEVIGSISHAYWEGDTGIFNIDGDYEITSNNFQEIIDLIRGKTYLRLNDH